MIDTDVVIIGAGPAGIFTAYELKQFNSEIDVTIIDKGRAINTRHCPVRYDKNNKCVHCNPCNIMSGFGGAGTFSDCKLSLTPFGVGGIITDYISGTEAKRLISKVDDIFSEFDNDASKRKIFGDLDFFKKQEIIDMCAISEIDWLPCPTKHLGTDGTYKVMNKMYEYLIKKNVHFVFNADVKNVSIIEDGYKKVEYIKNSIEISTHCITTDNVVFAMGRSGSDRMFDILCNKLKIGYTKRKSDIGVRVETKASHIKKFTDRLYDMKLFYINKDTGDKVRTFCTNPNGFVSEERYTDDEYNYGIANGHSFSSPDMKTENSNFALLVTLNDNNTTTEYARNIVKLCNIMSDGHIIKQNYLDFLMNKNCITEDTITPTLTDTINIDLNLVLPNRIKNIICSFIKRLNMVCPGIASSDTIIYGPEVKFYSDLIQVDNNMQTSIPGIYAIGDGSGITRGISQSASTGIIAADNIIRTRFLHEK